MQIRLGLEFLSPIFHARCNLLRLSASKHSNKSVMQRGNARVPAAFAPRDQSLEAPMPRLHARSRKFYARFRFARFGRCASSGKTAATTGRRLR